MMPFVKNYMRNLKLWLAKVDGSMKNWKIHKSIGEIKKVDIDKLD